MKIDLGDGNQIPQIGFGTWKLKGDEAISAIDIALETGYRHIDTADRYKNHTEVGKSIKSSGIKREDIFLTSKIWFTEFESKKSMVEAGKRFLEELDTSYLDLILLHWPTTENMNYEILMEGLAEIIDLKISRNVGVSNFRKSHLIESLKHRVKISNNQFELHPSLYDQELCDFCIENEITITGYSPLAWGNDMKIPQIIEIAEKYQASPAQICLNWQISKGFVTVPRSKSRGHIEDNFKAIKFIMKPEDIEIIDNIDMNYRVVDKDYVESGHKGSPIDANFEF